MVTGHVLIVDNEPSISMLFLMILEAVGYSGKCALNKSQALEALALETFQVAVVDYCLDDNSDENDLSGIHLMYEIHKNYPNIKVIIISGYATISVVKDALQSQSEMKPAFAFFGKSDEPAHLVEYVKKAFVSITE